MHILIYYCCNCQTENKKLVEIFQNKIAQLSTNNFAPLGAKFTRRSVWQTQTPECLPSTVAFLFILSGVIQYPIQKSPIPKSLTKKTPLIKSLY
jgi:hypothetical protein